MNVCTKIHGVISAASRSERCFWVLFLDLLQEISNRLKSEADRVWDKVSSLAYDATIGLLKQYQVKLLELTKITLASFYIGILRTARKHFLLFCFLFFGTMVSAVAAVVIPVSVIVLAPWSFAMKIVCLLVLGSFYIGGTAWVFLLLFSQENWLRVSGMKDLLDSISSFEAGSGKF